MAYCTFILNNGKQTCSVCGASFVTDQRVMAVCGVDRPKGPPPPGAGTQLKKLLARLGIKPSPTCRCASKAQMMDYKGVDWCEENIDTITEWLREEATKRGLPFVNTAGRMLVRRAISNARKEAGRAKNTT